MKGRWHKEGDYWQLRSGATVLAEIRHAGECFWTWTINGWTGGGWGSSRLAAQRQVRKALREL